MSEFLCGRCGQMHGHSDGALELCKDRQRLAHAGELTLNEYQERAKTTAIYPRRFAIHYPAVGLSNEAGELLGKVKKAMRDDDGEFTAPRRAELIAELGDVLWYAALLADDLDITRGDVAQANKDKLLARQQRGVLQGSGDNR